MKVYYLSNDQNRLVLYFQQWEALFHISGNIKLVFWGSPAVMDSLKQKSEMKWKFILL